MVSVIVPVYNSEKYLDNCIISILGQSYKDIEVLIIDDGSTDNSYNIALSYAKIDNRLKVIHKENGGVSSARNVGLDYARGRYITFVDSDDYINYKMIESMVEKMSDKVLLCTCYIKHVTYTNNHQKYIEEKINNIQWEYMDSQRAFLTEFNNRFGIFARLYDRKLIGNIRMNTKYAIGEDLLFNSKIISNNKNFKIAVCHEKLYYYFIHNESVIHGHYLEPHFTQLYAAIKSYNSLKCVSNNKSISYILCNGVETFYYKYACADLEVQKKYKSNFVKAKKIVKKYRGKMNILRQNCSVIRKMLLIMACYFPELYLMMFRVNIVFKENFYKKESTV